MFTKPEALSIVPRSESLDPYRLPFRVRSVVASLGAHVALILLLRAVSHPVPSLIAETEKFRPEDHKIIYYDFRKKLPEVRPDRTTTPAPLRGAEVAKQTIIARSPQPKSRQQLVVLPAPPKLQLQEDVAQRNIIAQMRTTLPPLPAPPPRKEPPKPEVKQGVKMPTPAVAAEAPRELNKTAEVTPDPVRTPKVLKAFTPPPPSPRTPRLTLPTAVLDAPAPLAAGTPALPTQLSQGAAFPVISLPSAPPPSNAPTAAVARNGNSDRDIVIVSVRPTETGNALPTGDRPGEFSKAPAVGAPSASGDGKGLIIPNLVVHEEPPKPAKPPPVAAPMRTVVYTELMRNIPISTYSAPLRPGVRSIPRNLEPRFQQRIVYTIVVPIENLPIYGGDWIIWFAERESAAPGVTPVMRAPLPFKKQELVDATPPAQRSNQRLQIAGVLEKDGKIGELALLSQASREVEQAVLRDVGSWEFKPATRNGAAVGIDIVFEIPFNLPPLKASN